MPPLCVAPCLRSLLPRVACSLASPPRLRLLLACVTSLLVSPPPVSLVQVQSTGTGWILYTAAGSAEWHQCKKDFSFSDKMKYDSLELFT